MTTTYENQQTKPDCKAVIRMLFRHLMKNKPHRLSKLTRNVASPAGGPRRRGGARPPRGRTPERLSGPRGLVKCHQIMKSAMIACIRDTL